MKRFCKELKSAFTGLPVQVRHFLRTAFLVILCWKLTYYSVLKPIAVPDSWLTEFTGRTTAKLVSYMIAPAVSVFSGQKAVIIIDGKNVMAVGNSCNALELFVLYSGFLLCLPASAGRMIRYMVCGVICIFLLNILRCSALTWLNIYARHWADLAHHYVFQLVVYGFMFCCWVRYCNVTR